MHTLKKGMVGITKLHFVSPEILFLSGTFRNLLNLLLMLKAKIFSSFSLYTPKWNRIGFKSSVFFEAK